MDYEGEQQMEVEALEAILMEELEEYEGMVPKEWSENMVGKVYKVTIRPNEEDLVKIDYDVRMDLIFAQTKQYPETEPFVSIKGTRGLNQNLVDECMEVIKKEIQANLGISMIYQLITVAKDWISVKVEEFGETGEETDQDRRKRLDKEEEARTEKRRYGTSVTLDTFLEWRKKFREEIQNQKTQDQLIAQEKEQSKLSGKQIFFQQYNKQLEDEKELLEDSDEEDDTNIEDTIKTNNNLSKDKNSDLKQNGQLQEESDPEEVEEDDEDFLEDYLAQKTSS